MPFFKDPSNKLHFLSDEDVLAGGESLLPNGCTKIHEEDAVWPNVETLEQHKASKMAEINARYEEEIRVLTAGYPPSEQQSWSKQEAEARFYQADSEASTPYLSALAAARGISLSMLVGLVIENADAFAVASATLTGRRQAARDAITAATTAESVSAVTL